MELMEAIKGRRSVYAYKPDPVPEDVLMQILDAAMWAPSYRNSQPWEFVFLGAETRKELRPILRELVEAGPLKNPMLPEPKKEMMRGFMEDFGGAPTLLAVLSKPGESHMDKDEFPISAGLAVQNLMLTAHGMGLGTVWLSVGRHPKARGILQVPEGQEAIAVLAIGHPQALPPAPPREQVTGHLRRLP